MKKSVPLIAAIGLTTTLLAQTAGASTVQFADPSGLSAEATFALLNGGSTLQIALKNTSTAAPGDFGAADHLLTTIGFNLNGVSILKAGSAVNIGATSQSVNFNGAFGPGANISGEFGFGNNGNTDFGSLVNFVSASQGGNPTRFNGANLHGPANSLNGPSGGLISPALTGSIGNHAAVNSEVVFTLNLSGVLNDLSFLANGVRIEFGSDRHYLDGITTTVIPLPGAAGMAALGMALIGTRRRR